MDTYENDKEISNYAKNIFIDKDESIISVLGQNYLRNFIETGKSDKGYCILSNKRMYFFGRIWQKDAKMQMIFCDAAKIIEIGDVTGSSNGAATFLNVANIAVRSEHYVAVGFTMYIAYMFVRDFEYYSHFNLGFILIFLFMLITGTFEAILLKRQAKTKMFSVDCTYGGVSLKELDYSKSEISEFQKTMHRQIAEIRANGGKQE